MSDAVVLTDIDARGVARVTLNRPSVHNAFDDALIAELTEIFERLAKDDKVRAVVLASNGKSFSAGADLNWMKRMAGYSFEENLVDARGLGQMVRTLNDMPKPTIALVQGAAFGGGVGLVAACDIAIAAERAKFALTEVKLGIIPAVISPYVVEAIGPRWARRLFLTAERIDAAKGRARSGWFTNAWQRTSWRRLWSGCSPICSAMARRRWRRPRIWCSRWRTRLPMAAWWRKPRGASRSSVPPTKAAKAFPPFWKSASRRGARTRAEG